jgi:hypothetical protein
MIKNVSQNIKISFTTVNGGKKAINSKTHVNFIKLSKLQIKN